MIDTKISTRVKVLVAENIDEAKELLEAFINSGVYISKILQSESTEWHPDYGASWSVTYTIIYNDMGERGLYYER